MILLDFIIRGRQHYIDKLQERINMYLKFEGEAKEMRLKDGADYVIKKLASLGVIDVIGSKKIRFPESMTLDRAEFLLKYYKGKYPKLFQHYVTKNPLKLIESIRKTLKRSGEILRPHNAQDTPEWNFFVPETFNDALDIKLVSRKFNTVEYTAWTQGINFAFRAGDVIYRNADEYKNGVPALQIKEASEAIGTTPENLNRGPDAEYIDDDSDDKKQKVYFPGHIEYKDFEHDNKIVTTTQFDFVKMLIGI